MAIATIPQRAMSEQGFAFRNLIINGDMSIDQRNAGASVSVDGTKVYDVDRWFGEDGSDGVFTLEQSTTAPTGFNYSMKFTTTTADSSLGASQYAYIAQRLEGNNVANLFFGSASAKTVTLSFWVRSSLTGTFGGSLQNSAKNRAYPFDYTISVADTWEQKTVTIAGDTTGTWLTTNGVGLQVTFGLGIGSTYSGTVGSWAGANYATSTGATSVIGTLNATWYITGVQLEVGTSASDFEFLPFDVNLQRCQRYYQIIAEGNNQYFSNGFYYTATDLRSVYIHPVIMRASPSIDQVSGTNYYRFYRDNSNDGFDDFNTVITNNSQSLLINNTDMSGTAGQSGYIATNDSNSYLALTAEL